ncbi:MAG TPA: hypothetical protein VFR52_06285 [Sphingomicrobium sp.]|nr:hypothetical protein [Sphingomicrobium sp.]
MGARRRADRATVLSSHEDVDLLLRSPFATWRLKGPVHLRLLDRTPHLRRRFEARLDYLASVCGCAEGSIAGFLALLFLVVTWIGSGEGFSWTRAFTTLAIVICTSLAGKAARLAIARLQIRNLLREIANDARAAFPERKSEALS